MHINLQNQKLFILYNLYAYVGKYVDPTGPAV
jgi:hypothetical protein